MSATLSELQSMFPNIEASVVSMVIESTNNNMTQAMELLIEMSQTDDKKSFHRNSQVIDQSFQANSHVIDQSYQAYGHVMDQEFPEIPSPSRASLPSTVVKSPKKPVSKPASGLQSSSLSNIGTKISVTSEDKEWLEWIEKTEKLMIVMRGLPGSGKSSLAKRIVKTAGVGAVLSTDDYFSRSGQYRFEAEQLSEAHAYNHERASTAVRDQVPLVIIDNTNTMSWEFRPYIEMAASHGYRIQLLEPATEWKWKPKQLALKNSHGVPKQKIEQMLERYERNLTVDGLLERWNLKQVDDTATEQILEEESGEIFNSDNEDETDDAIEEVEDEESSQSTLNPNVTEFIPDFVAADDNTEEVVGDDISSLVNIFPHLTVEEATEMYDTPSINMKLDPGFADILQSYFGSPAPPDYLTKLPQDQMLSLDISLSMAKIIFTIWQQNVLTKLNDDSILESHQPTPNTSNSQPPTNNSFAQTTAPQVPAMSSAKTVLAPNAAAYYEERMMESATKASLITAQKKRPMIVVKDQEEEGYEELSALDLENLIEERDSLYRKAMDTKGSKMQGAASYYAAKARELNAVIKQAQKEQQMEMFLTINKGIPKTKLDLHFLQTGEAIKQLQHFIGHWEAYVKKSRNSQTLEIVTGRGNRSDNGKSRLRPAVTTWLSQKNFQYSEVNDGCLKVVIRPRK